MSSIFAQIIAGDIPCYKIYEDDKTFAFLDIHPETKGHTLVVPKVEVDKIYDLSEEDFHALMETVKKLSQHMEKQLGARVIWKVVGTDVPHAHVHLMPIDPNWKYGTTLDLTEDEFEQIRSQLEYHN
ncbi:HIT domain-containing protein [Candidatus Saccharibacteria bacterium]|nr:HIT domain-containing protein [Candidatus Saccharibacteria bacterium]